MFALLFLALFSPGSFAPALQTADIACPFAQVDSIFNPRLRPPTIGMEEPTHCALIYSHSSTVSGAAGEVVSVMDVSKTSANGVVVIIKKDELFFVYQHLNSSNLKKGQKVKEGQEIGKAQSTRVGNYMVNLQTWIGTDKVDPMAYLECAR